MSNDVRPYAPMYNRTAYTQTGSTITQTVQGQCVPSVTATAGVAASNSPQIPGGGLNEVLQIQIANKTSVWVHVNFGVFGNVRAATLSDYPVAPGAVAVVTVDAEVNGASVISDGAPAGATAVIFTRGSGT